MAKNESKKKKNHSDDQPMEKNTEVDHDTAEKNQEGAEQNGGEEITLTAAQINEIKDKMTSIEKERDDYLDAAKRVQADLENYRRRNASLRIDSLNEGKFDVFCELLPIIDNFERALLHAAEQEQKEGFMEGMDMIYRQLLGVLEKHGIEAIDEVGQQFDPNIQQAVLQEPSEDAESGTVLEILQKGYRSKEGKMLRYCMVKVAQ